MMSRNEELKEEIGKMVESIQNGWNLKQISRFIKNVTKEE